MIFSDKANRLDVDFGMPIILPHTENSHGSKESTTDDCFNIMTCDKHVTKEFDISVPVTISPSVTPQKPEVKCEGDVKIRPGIEKCKDPKKDFKFTVKQNVSVRIPIKYSVKTCYGEECFEAAEAA